MPRDKPRFPHPASLRLSAISSQYFTNARGFNLLAKAFSKPVQPWQSFREMVFDKAKLFVPTVAGRYFLMDMQPRQAISHPLLFSTTDSARQEQHKSYLDGAGKEACSVAAKDSLLPA
jgi:hypothetical protein